MSINLNFIVIIETIQARERQFILLSRGAKAWAGGDLNPHGRESNGF